MANISTDISSVEKHFHQIRTIAFKVRKSIWILKIIITALTDSLTVFVLLTILICVDFV